MKIKINNKELGVKLRVEDISIEHLKVIKKPKYGRGKSFNPCIDCHLMMIKEAGKIMKKEGFDFIATGEVLGQRPMSQNANALKIIDKWSGLDGLIVRPLSAKLLPPTILGSGQYSISGKSREMQLKLAKKFKIKNYPSPAGGCILTDINYGKNIKRLMDIYPSFGENDILILRAGRIFWEKDLLIVVARNEKECKELQTLKKKQDVFLEPDNFPGPTVIVRRYKKSPREEMIDCGVKYILRYSKNAGENPRIKI
jgi:tRNA-specific 2-thiouridylase